MLDQWDRFIRRTAHLWAARTPGVEFEDVYQAVRLGWVTAAARFDPGKGPKFSTYADWYGQNEARKLCHREAAGGTHVPQGHGLTRVAVASLDAPAGDSEGGLVDLLPGRAEPDAGPPADFWPLIRAALDERTAEVVELRYRGGFTLGQVGWMFGLSRERVRQVEHEGLATVRRKLPGLADLIGE